VGDVKIAFAMMDKFWSMMSYDIAIDLGTANTLVAIRGKGIMVREPTLLVRHKKTKQVLAVGQEAKKMLGKTPANLEAVRPLRSGVIADFDAAEALLHAWIRMVHEPHGWLPRIYKPRVIIGIPSGITEVERRAVQEAAFTAGARKVWLVEEPMAAAIGSGAPVEEPTGVLIVDIGGGTTEIAAISLSGMVVKRSIKMAGDEMDNAIIQFVRNHYGLLIGEATAERIKLTIGKVSEDMGKRNNKKTADGKVQTMIIRGRDLESGVPKSLAIQSDAISEALYPIVKEILEGVQDTIEEVPPELVSDILERGIILAGGGALLPNLESVMAEYTKMPVWVADDPLTCVVRGCLALYERPVLLERVRMVGGLR